MVPKAELQETKGEAGSTPILALWDLYAVPGSLDFTLQVMEAANESDLWDDFSNHVEDELERQG